MTKHDTYVEVAAQAIAQLPDGEESVLACMLVLHTHDLLLADGFRPSDLAISAGVAKLHAVTRRHAAEIVAAALGQAADQGAMDYWYAKYSTESPYEVIDSVPQPLLDRVLACQSVMTHSPLLQDIVPSD